MSTREQFATRLTKELGMKIVPHKSCYLIWDGKSGWFPFYTENAIRSRVQKIKERVN